MSKIVRLVGLKENGIDAMTSAWVSANDLPWIIKEYEAKWFPLRVVLLESDEEVPWGMSHDYESFDSIRTAATALRARIAELESSLPKTKDGEVVVLGLWVWVLWHDDGIYLMGKVVGMNMAHVSVYVPSAHVAGHSSMWSPIFLYRRHPDTGLTPEEVEAKK